MDSITLENELKKLVPASLHGSLLDQLDSAMVAAVTEMSLSDEKIIVASSDTELSDLEECLRRLVPYGVPENLISRLDDAMARWHEEVPIDEKIVEINPDVKRSSSSWYGIRSVAAVRDHGLLRTQRLAAPTPEETASHTSHLCELSSQAIPPANMTHRVRSGLTDGQVLWTGCEL